MGAAEKAVPADTFSQGDVLQGKYTVEQFLAWMRIRPERFELHGDRIVCMSGTKKEHREAVRTLDEEIQKRKRAGCHVDIADAIKATVGTSPYYFPDLSVVCGSQEYEDIDGIDVLKNPCVVIEVLSRTTRKTDESFKLESHLGLPSVKLVVLVDTDAVTAAMHARDRGVRIEHRPTMRELAEQVARVVVELDCVG
jgi:Uma2 family endonuclease